MASTQTQISYLSVLGSVRGLSKMSIRDFKSKIYYLSDSMECFYCLITLKWWKISFTNLMISFYCFQCRWMASTWTRTSWLRSDDHLETSCLWKIHHGKLQEVRLQSSSQYSRKINNFTFNSAWATLASGHDNCD